MSDSEKHDYDEHINAVMIQNDVLSTAKLEGREEGRAEGREEGRAEGREEERMELARKFKASGVSIDIIANATGLSEEEINAINAL